MSDRSALATLASVAVVVAGLVVVLLLSGESRATPKPCRWEVMTTTSSTAFQAASMPEGWEPFAVARATSVSVDLLLRRCR